ncbi:pilus assembly protein N-terminal domain-containing protein [Rhodopirellula sp. MGV]|uniref:pilus assembly protein N-terminal domain-containing protein n=1 Tax=Rhodopirellula sp. MGV TaxID=2023130 RepID=UPI000B97A2A6|nr:pilus assembly protein N-terminal domain-containing protein [Rhodopirellula sp. MGV]OYP38493.1 hypothetical protein CGZ80_01705 [Rhodopirellula sp. MGV]PNY33505.1 hypothetical protein C2E31_28205 [Rhodopirellula baltica]
MRATSTQITTKPVLISNKFAKRALLMSFVLASSSFSVTPQLASAQQPTRGTASVAGQGRIGGLQHRSTFVQPQGSRVVSTQRQEGQATDGQIRSNPFFAPVARRNPNAHVQLASGDEPNVRLKQAETSIGFQSIDQAPASQQGKGNPRINPLVQNPNRDWDEKASTANAFEKQAALESTSAPQLQQVQTPVYYPQNEAAKGTVGPIIPVTETRENQAVVEETQPIFFTLSDDSVAKEDLPEATQVVEEAIPPNEESLAPEESLDIGAQELPIEFVIEEAPMIDFSKLELAAESNPPTETELAEALSADLSEVDSPVTLAPVVSLAAKVPTPLQVENSPKNIQVNPNVPASEVAKNENGTSPIQVNTAQNATPLVVEDSGQTPVVVAMPPSVIEQSLSDDDSAGAAVFALTDDPTFESQQRHESASQQHAELQDSQFEATADALADLPPLPEVEPAEPVSIPSPTKSAIASGTPALETEHSVPKPVFAVRPPSINTVAENGKSPLIGSPVEVDPMRSITRPNAKLASVKRRNDDLAGGFAMAQAGPVLAPAPNASLSEDNLVSEAQQPTSTGPAIAVAKSSDVVLNLKRAQVRAMTIGGTLRGVTIADKDVCQAFAAGPNQFKLIGTGLGSTTLTVWADVAAGEPTRKQTFRIDVIDSVDAKGDKVAEHTSLLNDSICKAFPAAEVFVSKRNGKLYVEGRCSSESDATKIVRMVRKSCLIPVEDNLIVR